MTLHTMHQPQHQFSALGFRLRHRTFGLAFLKISRKSPNDCTLWQITAAGRSTFQTVIRGNDPSSCTDDILHFLAGNRDGPMSCRTCRFAQHKNALQGEPKEPDDKAKPEVPPTINSKRTMVKIWHNRLKYEGCTGKQSKPAKPHRKDPVLTTIQNGKQAATEELNIRDIICHVKDIPGREMYGLDQFWVDTRCPGPTCAP